MMEKQYLIFLDVDGVFTSARVHEGHTTSKSVMWDKFDPVAVDFMNKLDDKYKVHFVLMSTWKNSMRHNDTTLFHWMITAFRNAGFRGDFPWPFWKTDPLEKLIEKRGERAWEVKDYLENYGKDYDDYLLFDDSGYRFNEILGKKRHIKTNAVDGLLHKQMLHALSITGQWEKRNVTKT